LHGNSKGSPAICVAGLPARSEVENDCQFSISNFRFSNRHVARPSWPCFHGLEAHATSAIENRWGLLIYRKDLSYMEDFVMMSVEVMLLGR